MKLFNTMLIRPRTFGCLMRNIDEQYDAIMNNDTIEVSEEAIDLLKIWKNITNSFGDLINTLKENSFNNIKTLKNSELIKYIKENKSAIANIEKVNYDKLMDVVLLTPNNMSDKYYDAVKSTEDFFKTVDFTSILKFYDKAFTDIYRDISKKNIDFKKFIGKLKVNNIDKLSKKVKQSFDKHIGLYSNNGKREVPFKQLFENMKQFKDVKSVLLSNAQYIKDIANIESKMNNIHELLENMLEVSESIELKLDKAFIVDITKVVEFLAQTADIYSNITKHLLALEHNYCVNMTTLKNSLK